MPTKEPATTAESPSPADNFVKASDAKGTGKRIKHAAMAVGGIAVAALIPVCRSLTTAQKGFEAYTYRD